MKALKLTFERGWGEPADMVEPMAEAMLSHGGIVRAIDERKAVHVIQCEGQARSYRLVSFWYGRGFFEVDREEIEVGPDKSLEELLRDMLGEE